MLEKIKLKCGIASGITVFNTEIQDLINSAKADLMASGVIKDVITSENEQLLNAITCYVKAYRGNDRTDTDKYLKMYGDLRLYLEFLTVEDLAIIAEITASKEAGESFVE